MELAIGPPIINVIFHPHSLPISIQLSTLIEKDISGLTENTLDNMCLQWEALVTAEEAEQSLQEFLTESGLTAQDQQQKQITSVTTSEIIMSYFSP